MITEDGQLRYQVHLPGGRGWLHRLRHVVNPVVGISCGLAFGAALFVIAVQALFGVRPSVLAIVLGLVAVLGYGLELQRARMAAFGRPDYRIVIDDRGVAVDRELLGWQRFTRWLEDDQDFVLVCGGVRGRMIVVLPKQDIAADEQDLLREVFHAQIDPDDEPIEEAFVEMNWDEQPARPQRPRSAR
ncbi:MAG: YcxB family protein [Propionibacteriaceae bacterium]|nr:YcxB family protein [Propionibacteriaceae bacterium]